MKIPCLDPENLNDPTRRRWLQAAGALGAWAAGAPGAWAQLAADAVPMRVAPLADALAGGQTTALAMVELALARALSARGEGPRCFSVVHAEQARAAARAVDARRRDGRPLPPLAGVPVAVQDVLDEAGQRSLAGPPQPARAEPALHDAASVRRLRDAGLVLLGRTRSSPLAWPGLGLVADGETPRNRHDRALGRVPGGGAAGAAVAVADGMVAAAIGNDCGGGLRVPAALQGLVGWKPTARRVPREGLAPLSPSLDSIGVIAHSVEDCALLDGVLAAGSAALPAGPLLRGLRLGIPTTLVRDGLAPEVAHAFQIAIGRLSAAGVQVVELALPAFGPANAELQAQLLAAEAHATLGPAGAAALQDPRLQAGGAVNERQLAQLRQRRESFTAAVNTALAGFHGLLMPSTQDTAPTLAQATSDARGALRERVQRNAALVNLFDGCALTLPCQPDGAAPVGLTLAGPAGSDAQVLGAGRSIAALLASTA